MRTFRRLIRITMLLELISSLIPSTGTLLSIVIINFRAVIEQMESSDHEFDVRSFCFSSMQPSVVPRWSVV